MRLFSVIAPSLSPSLILRTVSGVRESSRSEVGTNGEQCGKERRGVPHSSSPPLTLLSFPLFLGNLEEDTGSEREILQGNEPEGRKCTHHGMRLSIEGKESSRERKRERERVI